jgi:DNA-binding response OmpR family regulator
MKILIVEDEVKVANFISNGLKEEGYPVDVAYDGRKGLALVRENRYDMILLDLMIPEIDGLELLRIMRSEGIDTPVLIITAKSSKEDVVRGLDSGSDDYLTKPFSFEELLARIRALFRRSSRPDSHILQYNDLVLNPYNRRLKSGNREIELTEKEFLIMELLMKNAEAPLSRKEIADYVWQNKEDSTNIVDVYINFLRKKIELPQAKRYIHTIRGVGYALREENEKA